MYYPNYNPFYMHNRNYVYPRSIPNTLVKSNEIINEKKDIEPHNSDTISFQDFYPSNTIISNSNSSTNNNNKNNENTNTAQENNSQKKNRFFSLEKNKISILGFSFEIDDLIIIGLIILLLLESDENLMLIIVLGLILLNINLNDIIKLF